MKRIVVINLTFFVGLLLGCVSPNEPLIGHVPVQITDQTPGSIQLHAFDLKSIAIVGDTISLDVTYGGGCKEHDFALFMSPAAFLESAPVQANLYLRHNNNGDSCKALIYTTASFDLRPIAQLYQQFYGRKDEIIINVFKYFENEPGGKLSASYFPD